MKCRDALAGCLSLALVPLAVFLFVGCGRGPGEGPLKKVPPRSGTVPQTAVPNPHANATVASPAAPNAANPEPAAWALTAEEDGLLDAYFPMGEYEIRPPKGFRYIKYIREAHAHVWAGPIRPDQTYTQLVVTVLPYPSGYTPGSVDNSLREVVGAIQKRRSEWTETAFEHGRIDGRDFARTQWMGAATGAAREGLAGRPMGGVVFLTVNDVHTVHVQCQDISPHDAEAIRLGSIAARSFRSVTGPAPSPPATP